MLASAGLFLLVALVVDWRTLAALVRDVRSLISLVIFGVFGVFSMQITYTFAIGELGAGVAIVLEQLALILILFYTCVTTRRRPRPFELIGLVCAFVGLICIATQGSLTGISISKLGLMWGLLSALAYAIYVILPAHLLEKWGSLWVTGLGLFFGGISASAVVQPWTQEVHFDAAAWGAFAGIVVLGTLGAYVFYLQGVKDAGPVKASLLCCIEPVAAMIISFFWLGSPISLFDALGCASVLTMIVLITLSKSSEKQPERDSPVFMGRASVLGYYSHRLATKDDLELIRALLDKGFETQSRLKTTAAFKRYPSVQSILGALDHQLLYVVETHDKQIIAVFALDMQGDNHYSCVAEGSWLSADDPSSLNYAALRWVTVDPAVRRSGVGRYILDTAEGCARAAGKTSLRLDTHMDNLAMQKLLESAQYEPCGILEFKNRLGILRRRRMYEKLLPAQVNLGANISEAYSLD